LEFVFRKGSNWVELLQAKNARLSTQADSAIERIAALAPVEPAVSRTIGVSRRGTLRPAAGFDFYDR
jgi:hypothetical protein